MPGTSETLAWASGVQKTRRSVGEYQRLSGFVNGVYNDFKVSLVFSKYWGICRDGEWLGIIKTEKRYGDGEQCPKDVSWEVCVPTPAMESMDPGARAIYLEAMEVVNYLEEMWACTNRYTRLPDFLDYLLLPLPELTSNFEEALETLVTERDLKG